MRVLRSQTCASPASGERKQKLEGMKRKTGMQVFSLLLVLLQVSIGVVPAAAAIPEVPVEQPTPVVAATGQTPSGSPLPVVTFILLIVLLPAVFTGLLSLGFYYIFAKAQPVIGKLAPVLIGLFMAVLVPVLSFVSLIRPVLPALDLVIILMGVLTPFMLTKDRLPDRHLSKIFFCGSVITVALLLVYGFATAFGGGDHSLISRFLMSLPLPEIGLPIMSLVMVYLAAVLISAVLFGAAFAVVTAFQPREVQNG